MYIHIYTHSILVISTLVSDLNIVIYVFTTHYKSWGLQMEVKKKKSCFYSQV